MWYFGPPFLGRKNDVAFVDAKRLRPTSNSDEVYKAAFLAGGVLQSLRDETRELPEEWLSTHDVPQRMVSFVREFMAAGWNSVPMFFRFVSIEEMRENRYDLRCDAYLENNDDIPWRPDVEIAPVLMQLRAGHQYVSVYLIGNNGAGKSLALHDIAMVLAMEERSSFGISFGFTDRFIRSPNTDPLKSFFTYAGARNLQGGPNYRRMLGEVGDMVKDIYRNAKRLACFQMVLDALGFSARMFLVPAGGKLVQGNWEHMISNIYPLSALDDRLDGEYAGVNEEWSFLPRGAYTLAVMHHEKSEICPFDSLSSGEQQILTMAIKIAAKAQENMVVLLDEPEISLHVAWQKTLPLILDKFARALNCSFVVATHSPVVIASAEGEHDRCFVMKNWRMTPLEENQRRSIESSLFEGFATYTPYTHHIQERCADIVSRIIAVEKDDENATEVGSPMLKELRDLREKLSELNGEGVSHDLTLVNKAIVAVESLLDPQ